MSDANRFAEAPLLAAEVPYYRIPRDDWELMLVRARQIGARTVCTNVPWVWHEPRPGDMDLDGRSDPRRDLAGFVRLCGGLGLAVILKPGPFLGADLLGGGIPPWLLHGHPELHALRPDGQPWRHAASGLPRACYLHPSYLAAARRWIAAFSQAARPLQAPDGPVIAVQVDHQTPGDGMLPAGAGVDPRLRLDYNPHVTEVLWPRWRAAADGRAPTNDQASAAEASEDHPDAGPRPLASGAGALPRSFAAPATLAELRPYVELEAFTDWYHAEALATLASWLRAEGWVTPLLHGLLAAPWEAGGTAVGAPGLARAVGWLGQTVEAQEVREPFVGGGSQRLSFEEYVHVAHWRPRLMRALSPGHPAFVPQISAAQDFIFAAPLLGGVQGLGVHALVQSRPDEPAAGALPRRAIEAPVRPDGSLRQRFWNAKTVFTLLGAVWEDFAEARAPAAVAIGYSHVPERVGAWGYRLDYLSRGREWEPEAAELRAAAAGADHATRGQLLAQELLRAGVSFDVLDLDAAEPADLARYELVLVPACGVLARATQRKLAACAGLALVGDAPTLLDERLEPCALLPADALRLPDDVAGAQVAELLEQGGVNPRHAWADAPDVDVAVRHGERNVYLLIANRRSAPYSGAVAYRAPSGDVLHVHVGLGALRVGAVVMSGDEVLGGAMGGDGSEGGWLARGMFSSIVFNAGAGAVTPCGDGFALTAPQSGRFQLRRREGWDETVAYRLLTDGELLPAGAQFEAAHVSLPYVAEDERGRTDRYLLLSSGSDAPPELRGYLATLLRARAAVLRRMAGPPAAADTAVFAEAAEGLELLAGRPFKLEEYGVAWAASQEACAPAIAALMRRLADARGAYAAGALPDPDYRAQEQRLAWLLELAAHAQLDNDWQQPSV